MVAPTVRVCESSVLQAQTHKDLGGNSRSAHLHYIHNKRHYDTRADNLSIMPKVVAKRLGYLGQTPCCGLTMRTPPVSPRAAADRKESTRASSCFATVSVTSCCTRCRLASTCKSKSNLRIHYLGSKNCLWRGILANGNASMGCEILIPTARRSCPALWHAQDIGAQSGPCSRWC